MKSAKWNKIFEDCLQQPVPEFGLGQENHLKHTAKVTNASFEDNNNKVMKWPRQSPDMN